MRPIRTMKKLLESASIYFQFIHFNFSLKLIKDHCMHYIVKDENYNNIVMSNDFEVLDKPLMIEIVRKRVYPGRMNDIRISKLMGENENRFVHVLQFETHCKI